MTNKDNFSCFSPALLHDGDEQLLQDSIEYSVVFFKRNEFEKNAHVFIGCCLRKIKDCHHLYTFLNISPKKRSFFFKGETHPSVLFRNRI
jgi:hypothetical protein